MIIANYVVGTYNDITTEMEIPVPNAEKIIFAVDSAHVEVSMNDNQHYMVYFSYDGIVELACKEIDITKIFVRPRQGYGVTASIRIWAYI
jgi:hypothetical protein